MAYYVGRHSGRSTKTHSIIRDVATQQYKPAQTFDRCRKKSDEVVLLSPHCPRALRPRRRAALTRTPTSYSARSPSDMPLERLRLMLRRNCCWSALVSLKSRALSASIWAKIKSFLLLCTSVSLISRLAILSLPCKMIPLSP